WLSRFGIENLTEEVRGIEVKLAALTAFIESARSQLGRTHPLQNLHILAAKTCKGVLDQRAVRVSHRLAHTVRDLEAGYRRDLTGLAHAYGHPQPVDEI